MWGLPAIVRACIRAQRQRPWETCIVVDREVGDGVVVCGRDRRIVRIDRSEKLSSDVAQDEVGLSRALLGVGTLELAVGVVVGRSFRARQRSHMVAVLGLEGDEQLA